MKPKDNKMIRFLAVLAAALSAAPLVFFLAPSTALASTISVPTNFLSQNTGLVGWWTMDGKDTNWTTGTTNDISGNGNNGQLINMSTTTSPVAGKVGQAMGFNGSNSWVLLPDSTSLHPGNITISAWVYLNSLSSCGSTCNIASKQVVYSFRLQSNGKLIFYLTTTNNAWPGSAVSGNTALSVNKWYHVAVTYTSGSGNIYVNGNLDASNSTDTGTLVNSSNGPPSIGAFDTNGTIIGYLNGKLDDVRVYNRALSAGEVRQLYNMGSATHQDISSAGPGTLSNGLVGYWTFDGKDTNWATGITNDDSGNGNNGQLINMSTSTSPVVGKVGQALQFNGTNYISLSSQEVTNLNQFTISVWVKGNNVTSNDPIYMEYNGKVIIKIMHGFQSITFNAIRNYSTTNATAQSSNYYISGYNTTWHYVTAVFNNNAWTMYVDGVNDTQSSVSGVGTMIGAGSDLSRISIGASYYYNYYWEGLIDDFRVYNRALSASEVSQLYNMGSATHQDISSAGPGTLSQGLVGWWTMDGKDTNWATGVTNDDSGNANNGQLINMSTTTSPVAGKVGQAFLLNGTSNIKLPNSSVYNFSSTTNFTISAWVNVNSGGSVRVFNTMDGAGNAGYYFSVSYTGYLGLEVRDYLGNVSGISQNSSYFSRNTWNHVVVTFTSPSTVGFYVNGKAIAGGTLSTYLASVSPSVPAYIGFIPNVNTYSNGSLDDVRVYNRALSAQEVRQLYNMGK